MARYVYRPGHPKASSNGFVAIEDLDDAPVAESYAIHSGIMVDRFYENTKTTDGVDIGSRRKHRDYMKATGLAPASDFSPGYYERVRKEQKQAADRARRETVARAVYQKFK